MKNLSLLILVSFTFFSCNKKVTQPIVDYSTNYEQNDRMLYFSKLLKRQNKQTVVLINNKGGNMEDLRQLISRDKIKNLNIIKDSAEITRLNYSYRNVKTVILVNKK